MRVGELKKLMILAKVDLTHLSLTEELYHRFRANYQSLCAHDSDKVVTKELIAPLVSYLNEFWLWVSQNIPHDRWLTGERVRPILHLQQSLTTAGLLPRDYHYPILHKQLKLQFNGLPNKQLSPSILVDLLIQCSRITGFAQNHEIREHSYPLIRIGERIKVNRPQEEHKLKSTLFIYRTCFYLLHHYFTQEQLQLIPFFICFRTASTTEERRSEQAVFEWFHKKPLECLEFFREHEDKIDMSNMKDINNLDKIQNILPCTRSQFILTTSNKHWLYLLKQNCHTVTPKSERELINELLCSFLEEFACYSTKQRNNPDTFINSVKRYFNVLNQYEQEVTEKALSYLEGPTHDNDLLPETCKALYHFALGKYISERQKDPAPKHAPLSLSGKTKCHAAQKKQQAIAGTATNYGFFESLALKQGRLSDIVNRFEKSDTNNNLLFT